MLKKQKNYSNIAFVGVSPSSEEIVLPTYSTSNTIPYGTGDETYDAVPGALDNDTQPLSAASHQPRPGISWGVIAVIMLGVYTAKGSLAFLVIALLRPHYNITPSTLRTAALLSAVLAKTIEISFVTVFVAFLGQILSRRATNNRLSAGFNMAEFGMKMWIIQPGTMLTKAFHFRTGGKTFLGILALFVSVIALLYTTASDTLVSPKLQSTRYQRSLSGVVRNQFGDIGAVASRCPTVISPEEDPPRDNAQTPLSQTTCISLQFAGNCYIDLVNFSQVWNETKEAFVGNSTSRPSARTRVKDISYAGSWLNVSGKDGLNNVTLVMPHAGLVDALRSYSRGNIPTTPQEGGVGDYSVTAAIPNPALNIVCVPINSDQAQWFFSQWSPFNLSRNGTLDPFLADIFHFDSNATRTTLDLATSDTRKFEAPRFELGISGSGPIPFNMEVWTNNLYWDPSTYLLARTNHTDRIYTLCGIKTGLNADCATRYQSSGPDGGLASVDCSMDTPWAYKRSKNFEEPPDQFNNTNNPSINLKTLSSSAAIYLGLNSGVTNGNLSLSRLLTQLALDSHSSRLNLHRPSLAEALAVTFSNLLTSSSVGAPFRSVYAYNNSYSPNAIEKFDAEVQQIVYMSGATKGWEALFFVVLAAVFIIDLTCLVYFAFTRSFVTDWTDYDELMALLLDPTTSKEINDGNDGAPITVKLQRHSQEEKAGAASNNLRAPKTKLVILDGQSLKLRKQRRLSM